MNKREDGLYDPREYEEFDRITNELIKWLNDNCHPHCHVYVDSDHAELSEGLTCNVNKSFIHD